MTFVDAPPTREVVADIARRVDGRTLANMSETGRSPSMTAAELQELDYDIVIFPSTHTWLFAAAYKAFCDEVRTHGTTVGLRDRFMPFNEVNALLGLEEWQRPAQ